ncbi:MAG: SAM-dependent methyltransferase [Gammaproteobacteria bacterium HGW-Gammaproteobacteria-15]|nr:MAG: SAM-dependent methyltransferase [Gammaproteobacteria bacterium HGW-Gammaproteobacteria-15]
MEVVLNDTEFEYFQRWLHQAAGIKLTPAKKALVAGRLFKRLKHFQLASYSDYFSLISSGEVPSELQVALDLLTTNETYFFREPRHFDFLQQQILPTARAARSFRIWSAACSSGEEPYSIAMTLSEQLTTPWQLLASDISSQVLQQARTGHYPLARAHHIPRPLLVKYCLKGTGNQEGTFLINRQLREKIHFMQINLIEPFPDIGEFDVIFLRNVMIYFDQDTKRKVVAHMLPRLKPGGHFIVSLSESLNGITAALKLVSPSVYQKL